MAKVVVALLVFGGLGPVQEVGLLALRLLGEEIIGEPDGELAVFVELAGTLDGPLSAEVVERLRALRARVSAVEQDFDHIDFGTGDREVQLRIVAAGALRPDSP